MVGLSIYDEQCRCQSLKPASKIILSVKKDLPANGEYGSLVYLPQSHRYFIEVLKNNQPIGDLKIEVKNAVTGNLIQPEINIITVK